MRRGWHEFKQGWAEATWGSYFIAALFPLIMATSFLTYFIEGKVSSPPSLLFWLLSFPAILASLYWAGLQSGLDNWLGRFVYVKTLVFLLSMEVRRAILAGRFELTFHRRIGHYVAHAELSCTAGELSKPNRRPLPGWDRFRTALASLSLASQIAGRATWST